MTDDRDEIDDLLAPPVPTGAQPASREAIFRRTERALARGRLVRRVATVGTVATVFLVGGLGGWLLRPERVRTIEIATAAPVTIVVPVPVPAASPPQLSSPPAEPASPSQAELLAEQADDAAEAARLYRLAGDLYLNEFQDYRNASRCYRLFLLRAGDNALSTEKGDTWLLMSLKNAAYREKFHVAKTDG